MLSLRVLLTRSFVSAALALAAPLAGAAAVGGIACVTVAPAAAQDQPAGGPLPTAGHHRMGKILMSLGLSDDQKAKIRSIMADTRKQNTTVTDRDRKRANFAAALSKVEAVLTPPQRAKFDAARQHDQPPHS